MIEFNCGLQSSPICDIEVGASSVEGFGVPTLPQYPMLALRKLENEKGSVFSRCHVPSSSTRPTRYLRTMTNCYLRVAENSKHYTEEKVEKAPDVSRNTATARRLAKIKCRNIRFSKDCAEERSKHQTGPIFPEFQHGSLFEEHWRRGISQSFSAPSSTPQRFRHRFPPLLCRLSPEPCERGRAASLPVVHPVFVSSRDKPSSECTKYDIPLLLPRPGPQCCQPTGWRFVASCTTLRTRSCAVSGVGSRSGCSVVAHNACSRPLLGLAVLCFIIRLVIRLSSQASSVGPPATPRPPGLNRMRVQVRPVQALTRIEVCPWIEARSTWKTQTDTRHRSIDEPSPAPVRPIRAAKRSTSDGRTVRVLPTLVSFFVEQENSSRGPHDPRRRSCPSMQPRVFCPLVFIPSPVIAFFLFAGAPVEFHSCLQYNNMLSVNTSSTALAHCSKIQVYGCLADSVAERGK